MNAKDLGLSEREYENALLYERLLHISRNVLHDTCEGCGSKGLTFYCVNSVKMLCEKCGAFQPEKRRIDRDPISKEELSRFEQNQGRQATTERATTERATSGCVLAADEDVWSTPVKPPANQLKQHAKYTNVQHLLTVKCQDKEEDVDENGPKNFVHADGRQNTVDVHYQLLLTELRSINKAVTLLPESFTAQIANLSNAINRLERSIEDLKGQLRSNDAASSVREATSSVPALGNPFRQSKSQRKNPFSRKTASEAGCYNDLS